MGHDVTTSHGLVQVQSFTRAVRVCIKDTDKSFSIKDVLLEMTRIEDTPPSLGLKNGQSTKNNGERERVRDNVRENE